MGSARYPDATLISIREARPTKAYQRNTNRKSAVSPAKHGASATAWRRSTRQAAKREQDMAHAYSVAILMFGPASPCA